MYPLGTTTLIWTATDGSGNTASCTQDVDVTATCGADEHVDNFECVACTFDSTRPAGDNVASGDTACNVVLPDTSETIQYTVLSTPCITGTCAEVNTAANEKTACDEIQKADALNLADGTVFSCIMLCDTCGQLADRRRRTLLDDVDEGASIELTLVIGTRQNAHNLDKLVTTITLANENAVDFGDDNDGGSFTTGEIATADFPTTTTNTFDEFVKTVLAEKKLQGGGKGTKGKKGKKGKKATHDHSSLSSKKGKGKGPKGNNKGGKGKGKGTKSPKSTKGPKGNKKGGNARLQQAQASKARKEASAGVALVGIIGFVALIAVKKLLRDTDGERAALLEGKHAFAVPLEAAASKV